MGGNGNRLKVTTPSWDVDVVPPARFSPIVTSGIENQVGWLVESQPALFEVTLDSETLLMNCWPVPLLVTARCTVWVVPGNSAPSALL